MKYFRFELPTDEVNLYPIVCWHLGAKQSSLAFIQEVLRRIQADPLARVIYLGDGGECVTKNSKGNIYEQTLNPGDQLKAVRDLLQPVKDKILFGIRGNHGNRIDRESGLGWDEMLCISLGVPYLGISALGDLVLSDTSTAKVSVSLYAHHGAAGAISPAGKMTAGHRPEALVACDIALTAHTHACGECWPTRHLAYTDTRNRKIKYHHMKMYVCGSAYDSRTGYAEEKQYPVILPEHLVINVKSARDDEGLQTIITHTLIDGSLSKYAAEAA